jgi:dethiobiotin synthetase
MGAVLLVCGTGTEVGKTHFSVALLKRAGRDRSVLGFKPVESGCRAWAVGSDHTALADASTFHVKHLPEYCLVEPVSPHLAARREGRKIDVAQLVARVAELSDGPDLLLVETAGGLFSPLNDSALNADLARDLQRQLPQARTLLIAPDRLGVLHDLGATIRAALVADVKLDGIVLSSPASADASTGANAAELPHFVSLRLLGVIPRLPTDELSAHATMGHIYSLLLDIFSLPASSR